VIQLRLSLDNLNEIPLEVKGLTFQYHSRNEPAIKDISLTLTTGEILLLAGASGCGKTTLMRCINGLIPRIYRGELKGEISIFGNSINNLSMSELSQNVGTVLQDPERQIVGSYVFNEVAFGLENLGLPRTEILNRVDNTLEYLGISHLRDREVFNISDAAAYSSTG
jgi:energy-coupling factor transporter ATP-binding protein EcfA2